MIERFPKLQSVTIPGGLFGGDPKLPADDVKTVGASYRLMARASLSRAVAADVTQHLFEKRTVAAQATDAPPSTSRRPPTTPRPPPRAHGSRSIRGRSTITSASSTASSTATGDTLYLLGALGGGLVSALAWIRQRLTGLRRERIDEIIDRLLAVTGQARAARDGAALDYPRGGGGRPRRRRGALRPHGEADARALSAATVAIETARATLADIRERVRAS